MRRDRGPLYKLSIEALEDMYMKLHAFYKENDPDMKEYLTQFDSEEWNVIVNDVSLVYGHKVLRSIFLERLDEEI